MKLPNPPSERNLKKNKDFIDYLFLSAIIENGFYNVSQIKVRYV